MKGSAHLYSCAVEKKKDWNGYWTTLLVVGVLLAGITTAKEVSNSVEKEQQTGSVAVTLEGNMSGSGYQIAPSAELHTSWEHKELYLSLYIGMGNDAGMRAPRARVTFDNGIVCVLSKNYLWGGTNLRVSLRCDRYLDLDELHETELWTGQVESGY